MNNQDPNLHQTPPFNVSSDKSSNYHDWRDQRRAERWARHEARWQRHAGRHYGWIGGVILLLLGVTFFLQNLGIPFLANWWALFFLIPAFCAYVAAWEIYKDHNRLTRGGAGSLTMGIMLTILVFVFLLNLNIGLFCSSWAG